VKSVKGSIALREFVRVVFCRGFEIATAVEAGGVICAAGRYTGFKFFNSVRQFSGNPKFN
jgi:hypothetical protein